jgi:hypothetical protein
MSPVVAEAPGTAAAAAADEVARRYCSSALYAHGVRSYLWGLAYAQREALPFDVELFYVAAMLHDMWPSVDRHEDVEGHLLEVATGIDISGRGLELISPDRRTEVVRARPRLDLTSESYRCLRAQGDRKPTSRAAELVRDGLADALRDHPLEGSQPT